MTKLEKDDYFLLFTTPRGERVLEDLCRQAPLLLSPIPTNVKLGDIKTNVLLVEQGRSDILKYIYAKMKVNPFEEKQQFAEMKGK